MDNIVAESDFQIVISSINGQIDAPTINITDIRNLVRNYSSVPLIFLLGIKRVLLIVLPKGLVTLLIFLSITELLPQEKFNVVTRQLM